MGIASPLAVLHSHVFLDTMSDVYHRYAIHSNRCSHAVMTRINKKDTKTYPPPGLMGFKGANVFMRSFRHSFRPRHRRIRLTVDSYNADAGCAPRNYKFAPGPHPLIFLCFFRLDTLFDGLCSQQVARSSIAER